MSGYTTREVAELTGLSVDQVRHYLRRGLITPGRGVRGEYRFDFPDVVLLRTARGLRDASVSPRRTMAALMQLRVELGDAESLASLRILESGGKVVVRNDDALWDISSGQGHFNFSVGELVGQVAQLHRRRTMARTEELDSDDFFNLGVDLEDVDPQGSEHAYRQAVALDPDNVDAHVNLGRMLQCDRRLEAAAEQYEAALARRPDHQLALYNLGTLHDERDDLEAAVDCYYRAGDVADAHYNLCRIFEIRGDEVAALRHLRRYRQLVEG
jgi:DNA-binding transcriptional MerR regulator